MSTETHLASLSEKHSHLEAQICEENQRPCPDSLRITELKRQKLKVKDEIERLSH